MSDKDFATPDHAGVPLAPLPFLPLYIVTIASLQNMPHVPKKTRTQPWKPIRHFIHAYLHAANSHFALQNFYHKKTMINIVRSIEVKKYVEWIFNW